ncbi:gat [Metarhizium album ARSEF 1941]|uniref:Gat n=1 Tax=Metarhizium album (strain ARSEF 1941) TaxID=1081103 RepID=A0A0B2X4J9_METAS|nr:gat [Metarhizium album ARSEF 1941]KHO00365.1 gat [Metarhizium album ARSEF 1941]
MRSMKGLSMNRMLGSIKKKAGGSSNIPPASAATPAENPEVTAHNSVKAFCESGGNSKTDEVLFLPPIVDAAESSPAAAAECARVIRKFLTKDYSSRPSWQYNAIMLVRILTDNPGDTFTRNLDDKFVDIVRALLKNVKDLSVWQILMETLDDFEFTKTHDQNLAPLVLMWKKEKEAAVKKHGNRLPPQPPRPFVMNQPQLSRHSQNYFAKAHHHNRLPEPVELSSRLEEARTSAKLLEQVVMNTPPGEMLQNELIKEFADRCLSASRSLQGYMISENPAPDNETMESLIDTNEQLQTALNQHKRAVLNARKQLGLGTNSNEDSPAILTDNSDTEGQARHGNTEIGSMSGGVTAGVRDAGKGKQTQSYHSTPVSNGQAVASGWRQSQRDEPTADDPFADPHPAEAKVAGGSSTQFMPEFPHEPFHPGFAGPLTSHGVGPNTAGGSGSRSVLAQGQPLHSKHQHVSDDEDIYEAIPKGKGSLSKE